MEALSIDRRSTALVVIDLQEGIARNPALRPHSSQEVIRNAARLANAFRARRMPVLLVRVLPTSDTALTPLADDTSPPAPDPMPVNWADLVPELGTDASDVVVTKRQWGAFYGTELDLRLRRARIGTIVLCGVSTNYGVESTARSAYEHGYQQVFAEDAMSSRSEEHHRASVEYVLRRLGRVRTTDEILAAVGQ